MYVWVRFSKSGKTTAKILYWYVFVSDFMNNSYSASQPLHLWCHLTDGFSAEKIGYAEKAFAGILPTIHEQIWYE